MPTLDEVRQLIARSRLAVRQDRVYLRRLNQELTQSVIERATIAYTVSDRLLRKIDGFAFAAPDHRAIKPPLCHCNPNGQRNNHQQIVSLELMLA